MSINGENKTRLLILIPSLECGGTEKFVIQLCEYIDTCRFEVTFAVLNNAQPFFVVRNPAIKVIDLKVKRVRTSLFAIRRTVKEFKPDILFSLSNHLNLYLAIYRRLFPKEIRLIGRESSIPSFTIRRSRHPFIYRWLMKKFYHRFDGLICQSKYMQQDLIQHFGVAENKTFVSYNMVDEVQNDPVLPSFKAEPSRIITFITVARLSEEKGIERLIRSVSLLPFYYQYHIIGEGDQRAALERLVKQLGAEKRIFLHGKKYDPYEGLIHADLFLLGSSYEGFPNVLLEAGALGIPVVAFDAPGGIKEIIQNGENGFLVTATDFNSFAATIQMALAFKFDRKNIIAVTKKRFPMEATIKGLEQLFLSITE